MIVHSDSTASAFLFALVLVACGGESSGTNDDATSGDAPLTSGQAPDATTNAASTSATVGDDSDGAQDDTGSTSASTGAGPDPSGVAYYDHVLPIAMQQCATCHVAGGIAPFDITDYATAVAWAPSMMVATEARRMPPNPANNDGTCNTFANARWLSDDEIATFAAWVEGGTLEGDPTIDPGDPPPLETLAGNAIVELQTPAGYQPVVEGGADTATDDYQCFLVDPDFASDTYVLGTEGVPGNAAITHHMVFYGVDPDEVVGDDAGGDPITNAMLMAELDAQSPDQPGWDCLGSAGDGVVARSFIGVWLPGAGATNHPEGSGIHMSDRDVLVVQMHYSLHEAEGTDSSTIRLAIADEVDRVGYASLYDRFLLTALTPDPASLPPGEELFTYTWEDTLATAVPGIDAFTQVEVHSILPHMHGRGRTMAVEFLIGGEATCGVDVDRWDFHWQINYDYDRPIVLSPSDTVRVTCGWDTTQETQPVYPGFGTDAEMCLIGLYVVGAD